MSDIKIRADGIFKACNLSIEATTAGRYFKSTRIEDSNWRFWLTTLFGEDADKFGVQSILDPSATPVDQKVRDSLINLGFLEHGPNNNGFFEYTKNVNFLNATEPNIDEIKSIRDSIINAINNDAKRSPPWSRDERILTLDFYLQHRPTIPGQTSKEVADLSRDLHLLQTRLGGKISDKFRNENGVYMKACNFMALDPSYPGKGLTSYSKNDKLVWNEFSHRPDELRAIAETIRSFISTDTFIPPKEVMSDDEEEGEEGQILTRTHRYRERDTKLVKRKKERVLKDHGTLSCEACGFDFGMVYGDHGNGYIECHHTKPVSEMKVGEKTKTSELSLVCSNCHRMIHRKRPWLSVEALKMKIGET